MPSWKMALTGCLGRKDDGVFTPGMKDERRADKGGTSDAEAALPLVNEDGVDLTLIRWSLGLTATERVRVLEGHMEFAEMVRTARRHAAR